MSVPVDPSPVEVSDEPQWRWLCADDAGVVLPDRGVAFTSQVAAEDWLRDQFDQLAEDGVATVCLMDGEHAVYGPMYLGPDGTGPAADSEI